ncbi:MAG: IctB family putative bicarbonate transporter [Geminocystis sp.]|nr:IctB family putative bicarbonate transporter [Geminocystis sp.]MCS7147253.1 IctB family putative bicarbonate transporter [Geminocystis sp.]HIK37713.1 putative bicarbonate transporter, IctB family [Geminocystis sp. M7585_C2015_104]
MQSADYSPVSSSPWLSWRKHSWIGKLVGILSPWREDSYLLAYSEPIATVLVCLVIIASPFAENSLVGVFLVAAGGFWLLLTLAETKNNQITAIHLWVFAYFLISVVATAFSPLKLAALVGLVKFTLYLLFFCLCARILASPRYGWWIITVYLLVALIVGAYGIRQKLIGVKPLATWNDPTSPLAEQTRVYSFLGNPNLLAGYLIPAVAFSVLALVVWKTGAQKFLAAFCLLISVSCIYYTGSRGGWLGLVATAIVFLLGFKFWWSRYLSPFWRKWLIPIALAGFLALVGMGIILSEPLRLRIFSLFAWREDSSNNFRINVWMAAIQMFKDYFWLGIGLGNKVFNQIYPLYMQTKYTALSTYCIFLEVAIETGIIGFVAFMGIIVSTVKRGIGLLQQMKPKQDLQGVWVIAALAAMAGLATQGLFDTVWYRPQVNTLWWLAVAVIARLYSYNPSSAPPQQSHVSQHL